MKEFKRQVNRIARAVLFYNILLLAVILGDTLIQCVRLILEHPDEAQLSKALHQLELSIGLYGGPSIIGIAIGILFLILYFRRDNMKTCILASVEKMRVSVFLQAACVLLGFQFLFSVASIGFENGLNAFGYTIMGDVESATSGSTTISMFLYASLLGPAAEEIVYRGFVLQSLKSHGKEFAIIVCSVLFGVMHGNFIQGMFAFCVGIVLAYITIEYSIYWAILLHIINNCVMGDIWPHLISGFSANVQTVLNWGIISVFFAGGLLVLWRNRIKLKCYVTEHMAPKKYYRYAFTSIWMILFLGIEFLAALSGIQKLP